jgi:DNA mismatch repair protein MutS2
MAISSHTLDTLEFPKVLGRLASYTSFSASKELALALRPATDVDEVRARQRRTSECVVPASAWRSSTTTPT